MNTQYRLIFLGEVLAGFQPLDVQRGLRDLFELDNKRAAMMFSGRQVVVKRGIELAKAQRYMRRFSKLGAILYMEVDDGDDLDLNEKPSSRSRRTLAPAAAPTPAHNDAALTLHPQTAAPAIGVAAVAAAAATAELAEPPANAKESALTTPVVEKAVTTPLNGASEAPRRMAWPTKAPAVEGLDVEEVFAPAPEVLAKPTPPVEQLVEQPPTNGHEVYAALAEAQPATSTPAISPAQVPVQPLVQPQVQVQEPLADKVPAPEIAAEASAQTADMPAEKPALTLVAPPTAEAPAKSPEAPTARPAKSSSAALLTSITDLFVAPKLIDVPTAAQPTKTMGSSAPQPAAQPPAKFAQFGTPRFNTAPPKPQPAAGKPRIAAAPPASSAGGAGPKIRPRGGPVLMPKKLVMVAQSAAAKSAPAAAPTVEQMSAPKAAPKVAATPPTVDYRPKALVVSAAAAPAKGVANLTGSPVAQAETPSSAMAAVPAIATALDQAIDTQAVAPVVAAPLPEAITSVNSTPLHKAPVADAEATTAQAQAASIATHSVAADDVTSEPIAMAAPAVSAPAAAVQADAEVSKEVPATVSVSVSKAMPAALPDPAPVTSASSAPKTTTVPPADDLPETAVTRAAAVLATNTRPPADTAPVGGASKKDIFCPHCGFKQPVALNCVECGGKLPVPAAAPAPATANGKRAQTPPPPRLFNPALIKRPPNPVWAKLKHWLSTREGSGIWGLDFYGRLGRISYATAVAQSVTVLTLASVWVSKQPGILQFSALMVALVVLTYSSLRQFSMRCHDLNRSGGWSALLVLPGIGQLCGLMLTVWPGTKGHNSHGAVPKRGSILLFLVSIAIAAGCLVLSAPTLRTAYYKGLGEAVPEDDVDPFASSGPRQPGSTGRSAPAWMR